MNISKKSIVRKGATLALMTAMVFGTAIPAFAAGNTITQGINEPTGGSLTASIADVSMDAVEYTYSDHGATGSMVLSAQDSTGSGAGWNVTVQIVADFIDATTSVHIPKDGFEITTLSSANNPTLNATTPGFSQPVNSSNGPKVPSSSPVGALTTARKVVVANATYGNGSYLQTLPVSLAIPGNTPVGSYVTVLETTASAGL
jgi:hypothetical protein